MTGVSLGMGKSLRYRKETKGEKKKRKKKCSKLVGGRHAFDNPILQSWYPPKVAVQFSLLCSRNKGFRIYGISDKETPSQTSSIRHFILTSRSIITKRRKTREDPIEKLERFFLRCFVASSLVVCRMKRQGQSYHIVLRLKPFAFSFKLDWVYYTIILPPSSLYDPS